MLSNEYPIGTTLVALAPIYVKIGKTVTVVPRIETSYNKEFEAGSDVIFIKYRNTDIHYDYGWLNELDLRSFRKLPTKEEYTKALMKLEWM